MGDSPVNPTEGRTFEEALREYVTEHPCAKEAVLRDAYQRDIEAAHAAGHRDGLADRLAADQVVRRTDAETWISEAREAARQQGAMEGRLEQAEKMVQMSEEPSVVRRDGVNLVPARLKQERDRLRREAEQFERRADGGK